MGYLRRIFEQRSNSTLATPSAWLLDTFGGEPTSTGITVGQENALRVSVVYACVRVISEDVAKLPLILYRRTRDGGKERAIDHPLYRLLHDEPNPVMTSFTLRQLAQASILLYGDAFLFIDRDSAGRPQGLWFLHPQQVQVERVQSGHAYELQYRVILPDGGQEVLPKEYVLHIPGLGFDGLRGRSVISYARESIGLYLAAQEYGGRFFQNDATPGLILLAPTRVTDDKREAIREDFRAKFGGVTKKFRMAILQQGWDLKTLGVPLEDAQFVEMLKFQVVEIARIFRVPPHKIQDLDRATYSNIEHQAIEYLTDTIEPWCVRWEQALNSRLLMPAEKGEYLIEFLMDALLRADTESRYRAYGLGIQWGFLTPDEVRAKENLNPRGGAASSTWMPVNMVPAQNITPAEVQGGGEQEGRRFGPVNIRKSSQKRLLEQALLKKRVSLAFSGAYEDSIARLTKREVQDIRRAAMKFLPTNTAGFMLWADQYYVEHYEHAYRAFSAPIFAQAEAIQSLVADEIGSPHGLTPKLRECIEQHVENTTKWNINAARNSLLAAAQKSPEEVDKILDEWLKKRPTQVARWETIRVSGLVSKGEYFFSGVPEIQWVELDGLAPCKVLDGERRAITGECRGSFFLTIDDELILPERTLFEGRKTFKPSWNVSTPPLVLGCTCQIMGVIE